MGSPNKSSRWWRRLFWTALALLLLPGFQVGCVRWVNPPGTPLMQLRKLEARWNGHPPKPPQYQWSSDIPPDFLRCVLLSEDQRFLQHHGFDWVEIARAKTEADRRHRAPRGASTITMQCARSLFLWQGRSWLRKGLEAYYTLWMEALLPKARILELYANVIETGDGVYGIEAAALSHYGQPAAKLSRAQCAMLTTILPNPRERSPRQPTPAMLLRQKRLLNELTLHPPKLP